LVMTLAIRPLNGLASPVVAAALALAIGGAIFGAVLMIFNVAGLRTGVASLLRAPRSGFAPFARPNS